MSEWVLDASALLALLNRERGERRVADVLQAGAAMSAVNLSEVVGKLADIGLSEPEIREALEPLGLDIVDFDGPAAYSAGMLRRLTRALGLSLGDRACLALGQSLGARVLTADAAWSELELKPPVVIELAR